MSDNWIVANLENAFSTWNDKMTEIWQLLTTSPQNFKGGAIWNVISGINGGLQAIGLGLLVLFFAMSIFKSTASFRDFQRPEYALKHFIRGRYGFLGEYSLVACNDFGKSVYYGAIIYNDYDCVRQIF